MGNVRGKEGFFPQENNKFLKISISKSIQEPKTGLEKHSKLNLMHEKTNLQNHIINI